MINYLEHVKWLRKINYLLKSPWNKINKYIYKKIITYNKKLFIEIIMK